MKKIVFILLGLLLISSVSAGVFANRKLTLTKERKAIAEEWNLKNISVWNETISGELVRVYAKAEGKLPKLHGIIDVSKTTQEDWVKSRIEYFIDKEIAYRNEKSKPKQKEVYDIK